MNKCLECGKETLNPKFCSKSCSATYNNKLFPKRNKFIKVRRCLHCHEILEPSEYYKGRKICDACKNNSEMKESGRSYERVKRNRKANKLSLAIDVGEGRCFHCGYSKCIEALEFHHPDPKEKDFTLSANMNRAYEDLLKEAKKCVVLCSNCHRELHAGLWELSLHCGSDG